MNAVGVVESAEGKYIMVRITRESACGGNCSECGGCGASERIVRAVNAAGAEAGNRVLMKMDSSKVLFAAFLVYILPLVILFAVYAFMFYLTERETVSTVVSIAALCVTFAAVHMIDKKLKDNYTLIAVSVL